MPLTVGVIDLAAVPPPDLLVRSVVSPSVLANPYSGGGSIATSAGGVQAYGIHWAVNTAPAGAGRSSRAVLVYEEAFLSFALIYALADASNFVGDKVLTGDAEGFYLFQIARPLSLHYNILAGWTVHFDWLVQP